MNSISVVMQRELEKAGCGRLGLGLFWLLASLLMAVPALAQTLERVDVASEWEGSVARLRLDWPVPVEVAHDEVGRVLVLRFARPFQGDLSSITRDLGAYVALAQQDRNLQALRLALKRPLEVTVRRAGRRIVVDLAPEGYSGALSSVVAPPPIPGAVVPPAPPPRRVSVSPVARPTRVSIPSAAPEGAPPSPERAGPEPAAPEPQPPERSARPAQEESAPETPSAPLADRVAVARESLQDGVRLRFQWPRPTGYGARIEDGSLRLLFARPGALVPLEADPPEGEDLDSADLGEGLLSELEEGEEDGRLFVRILHDPAAFVRHYRDRNEVLVDLFRAAPDDDLGEDDPAPVAEAAPALEAPIAQEEKTETAGEGRPLVVVKAEPHDEGVKLSFPWGAPVGAAVFRRGDVVWIAFDRPATLDLSSLKDRYQDMILDARITEHPEGTLLALGVHSETLAAVSRSDKGATWQVSLGQAIDQPTKPLTMTRALPAASDSDDTEKPKDTAKTSAPPGLVVALPGPGKRLTFIDPEAGDELAVVTLSAEPHGFLAPRRFADFQLLASAHGIAIDPATDDLEVNLEDKETGSLARVGRPGGLALSGPADRTGPSGGGGGLAGPGFMDVATWARGGRPLFQRNLQTLQNDVRTAADREAQTAARMVLAQFYMANDFLVEALGVMELIAADDPERLARPDFRALRGVTRLRVHRPADALQDLGHFSLRLDPNAALWRGVAHTALRDWAAARDAFSAGQMAMTRHDPGFQARFLIAEARTALGVNDLGGAEEALRRIRRDGLEPEMALELALLEGRLAEAMDEPDRALEYYRTASAGGHLPSHVQAVYRSVRLQQRLEALGPDDVIERLEQLRFRWRGDELELKMLKDLGTLYVQRGDIRQGLTIMRLAVQSFPGTEGGRTISQDMSAVFADLFLKGGADDMTPVQALALFYDFPELVPVGSSGDDMIRKLSDRLVAVDLLDQAAELLDHQVRFRLRGVAQAQVATKLALVHLMNREAGKALQVIHQTRQTRLPESLNRRRRLVEARSLSELGRTDHALEVIEGANRVEDRRLRADILWDAERWGDAALALERLVEAMLSARSAEEAHRFEILRAAIAHALADNGPGLTRLRQRYASVMANGPDARAFDIVTEGIETQGVAFQELAGRIANTDTLDAFMEGFRNQFASPPDPAGSSADG